MKEPKHVHDGDLAAAVALGWRVAELYSRVDDPGESSGDTLLPAHGSLAAADQLELHLRAAAGDAKRAGVTSKSASLLALVDGARACGNADERHDPFRKRLRACHVEINKDLWSVSEALGKAYELGNGLSDTYGRVCRAYRASTADAEQAWKDVFDEGRIERLKKLLDDLQSHLDGTAVSVVREQLDTWRAEVPKRLEANALPNLDEVRTGLRRQTVIWRQLIAGDKRPEAYLGDEERGRVRDGLLRLAWRRYRMWMPLLALVLAVCIFFLPKAVAFYQDSLVRSGIASFVVAALGAVGITQASLLMTARTRLQDWAELLWHCAVVKEVAKATLTIDQVLTPAQASERPRIVAATQRTAGRLRASVVPPRPASETDG
jgi:hypothetical protein